MQMRVQYFGPLREAAGISEETLETPARTPRELYVELCERHGFTLPLGRLMIAVNDQMSQSEVALKANDLVVFIPPIAGG